MKKTATFVAAALLTVGLGLAAAAPASALPQAVCNSGVAHAGHSTPAGDKGGLTKFALACHPG